jgi:hypothetical protein
MKDKTFTLDMNDEITRETLVPRDGHVVHERLKTLV